MTIALKELEFVAFFMIRNGNWRTDESWRQNRQNTEDEIKGRAFYPHLASGSQLKFGKPIQQPPTGAENSHAIITDNALSLSVLEKVNISLIAIRFYKLSLIRFVVFVQNISFKQFRNN